MLNRSLLKSFMALHGDNYSSLSKKLRISPQSLSMKINSKKGIEFNYKEILKIRGLYKMTGKNIEEIFFSQFSIY